MIYPKKLPPKGTVGLICPSSSVSEERLAQCVQRIRGLGYEVVLADNLTDNYAGYMAGKGEVRARWINTMFADPKVDAIFCVRGGDGSGRVMDHLDLELIKSNPKIFVGYSDVTSMHLAINRHCGFVTFHGPMVSSNMVDDFDDETLKSFFAAINADEAYAFQNPQGHELSVLKEGKAAGVLTGGNLSLLSASIGTAYEVDTKDRIFFIEDVDESVARIERYAYHLRNAGKFKDCAGVLLGQFTDCVNKGQPDFRPENCLLDVLEGLDIPVLANVQSGHDSPMMTLPLGAWCTVDTGDKSIRFGQPER